MPHEDFFEAKLIEFTYWEKDKEKTLKKYDEFKDLPNHLIGEIKENKSVISLKGKKLDIVEINKDLRAHGKGIHIKVRLQKHS